MSKLHRGSVLAAIAWFSFLAFGGYWLFSAKPPTHAIRADGVHYQTSTIAPGSQGQEREAELLRETRRYVESNPEADQAVVQGRQLAPPEFLNAELKRRHAKWRVRRVQGLRAEIYDVS